MRASAALAFGFAAVVLLGLALFASNGSDAVSVLESGKSKASGYSSWMCRLGWKEEGCGEGTRYVSPEISGIQDDTFDEKYDSIFSQWDKSTGNAGEFEDRVVGCDGKLGGATLDDCGVCGGSGGCNARKGFKVEYRQRLAHLSRVPVRIKPTRQWFESNGKLNLDSRAKFHTSDGDRFTAVYSGMIKIPADELYAFTVTSADGAKVFIDNRLVVDNDLAHSKKRKSGLAALTQGFHDVRIEYFSSGRRDPFLKLKFRTETSRDKTVELFAKKKYRSLPPPPALLPPLPFKSGRARRNKKSVGGKQNGKVIGKSTGKNIGGKIIGKSAGKIIGKPNGKTIGKSTSGKISILGGNAAAGGKAANIGGKNAGGKTTVVGGKAAGKTAGKVAGTGR